jgi:hypothetical protein
MILVPVNSSNNSPKLIVIYLFISCQSTAFVSQHSAFFQGHSRDSDNHLKYEGYGYSNIRTINKQARDMIENNESMTAPV